jgi:hypothetical protein
MALNWDVLLNFSAGRSLSLENSCSNSRDSDHEAQNPLISALPTQLTSCAHPLVKLEPYQC